MSFLDKYTESEIADFIAASSNFAEVLNKMGRSSNSGSNRILISHYAKEHNLDISHFQYSAKHRSPKDIFIEKSTATQNILRKYYKRGNYSEYKCAICGLEPFWNGMELTLTLDHINGIGDDHRLENLRWICPNCDRQLPTYGAKRKKIHAYCKQCGIEISYKNKTELCQKCFYKNQNRVIHTCQTCGKIISSDATFCETCFHTNSRKANRPKPLDLAKQIIDLGFESVGKSFGVSGNAVKKWCKHYNIPHTKKELIHWYDTQTNS